jgi:AbrB family looped-hinge helix DNA binding protein
MHNGALTKVTIKYQITLPREARQALRITPGDILEGRVEDGGVVFRPKVVVDRDPELERQLEASEADVKAGRVLGPFDNADDALSALNASKKRRAHARRVHRSV